MDVTTVVGLLIALGCILGGQVLEGGHVSSIVQLAAGLIVIGGTLGAVVTQFPAVDLLNGLRQCRYVIITQDTGLARLSRDLVELSRKSRREGLLVLENEALKAPDPFLRQALFGLVDGNDVSHLRSLLDSAMEQQRHIEEPGPKLLEAAGGYAPTIGILGAVLGLIHVMENLSDPSRLGAGIAVAFVATIYGVGAANLIFLPLAQKLRLKMARAVTRKEMILEAVCAIQEGVNPQMLEKRMQSFVSPTGGPAPKKGGKPPRAAARR
jgi:chemotaxis protein MotA